MKIDLNKPFDVKLINEGNYHRLYVTHPKVKGRIRKRLGNKTITELENIGFNLKFELGKQFNNGDFTFEEIETFIDNYVAMNIKCTASIFDYKEEFLKTKRDRFNKKTKKNLAKGTVTGFQTALDYFEDYLKTHKNTGFDN